MRNTNAFSCSITLRFFISRNIGEADVIFLKKVTWFHMQKIRLKIMVSARKRAIIMETYISTTLNNDKHDGKTFQYKIFQGYLKYIFAKFRHFLIIWLLSRESNLRLRG